MPLNLKNIPLFKGLPKSDLDAIAAHATKKTLRRNVTVITEGEFTQSLYLILSGKVKVFLNDEDGKEFILDVKGAGEYFGEMVLDEGPRSASVATMEPCELAIVSGNDFRQLVLGHPHMALSLIKNLIQMARGLNENVRSLATLDVYGRVSRLLLDLAVKQGEKLVVPEKLKQQDIANRVGASREVINRILRDLTASGHISIEAGKIIINRLPPRRG